MAVVDLEKAQAFHRQQVLRGYGPAKIGVVQRRQTFGAENFIHVVLDRVGDAGTVPGDSEAGRIVGIDVDWLLVVGVGHFFAGNQQELLLRGVHCIQACHVGQVIVVRQRQEVVLVLPVPGGHLIGRRIPIAVQRVGMEVSLVPALLRDIELSQSQ